MPGHGNSGRKNAHGCRCTHRLGRADNVAAIADCRQQALALDGGRLCKTQARDRIEHPWPQPQALPGCHVHGCRPRRPRRGLGFCRCCHSASLCFLLPGTRWLLCGWTSKNRQLCMEILMPLKYKTKLMTCIGPTVRPQSSHYRLEKASSCTIRVACTWRASSTDMLSYCYFGVSQIGTCAARKPRQERYRHLQTG